MDASRCLVLPLSVLLRHLSSALETESQLLTVQKERTMTNMKTDFSADFPEKTQEDDRKDFKGFQKCNFWQRLNYGFC